MRDSCRPCGCDPRANHVCERHSSTVDTSVTDIESAGPGLIGVAGPTTDGHFVIRFDGMTAWVTRFEAEDLVSELKRRLAL